MRKFHSAGIFQARVQQVQKGTYTLDAIGVNGEGQFTGIPVQTGYVGGRGQGSTWMPEAGTLVYLCRPSDQSTPMVLGGCAVPKDAEGDDDEQNDFRQGRPVLNEGDHLVASSGDGNFIILRKGGVIEVGASQTAQRLYIPINNFIRDFCQNYELNTSGGVLSFTSRRDDPTHGGGSNTPAEFRLRMKEFTGGSALIDLGFGRIEAEDGEVLVGGDIGAIVAKLVINDKFRVFIDRDGNMMHYLGGSKTEEFNGPVVQRYTKTKYQQVLGMALDRLGSRHVTVTGNDSLTVRNRTVLVNGNLEETVAGKTTRVTKGLSETVEGEHTETVKGAETKSVLGFQRESVTDAKESSVGKSYTEIVGGRMSTKVLNASSGIPEEVGYDVQVVNGELHIFALTGKVKLLSGGVTSDAVAASVTIKPSGTFLFESVGGVSVEANPLGAKLKTATGEVSVDQAGTVALGPAGLKGAVVTTLSHPVCYVTGVPILGSASVTAGGVPSPVGLPSTFLPDAT